MYKTQHPNYMVNINLYAANTIFSESAYGLEPLAHRTTVGLAEYKNPLARLSLLL